MKSLVCSLMLACGLLFSAGALNAQSLKGAPFKDRLWYGGNFSLGFSGSSNISLFQLGLAPMVGYKITPELSVGPRVSGVFSFYRARVGDGSIGKAQPVTWTAGMFTRYKVYREFFAHAEYEFANEAFVVTGFDDLEVERETTDNLYIGAGYNTGGNGRGGFEMMVLYNFNQPVDIVESPFSFRFGYTFNF